MNHEREEVSTGSPGTIPGWGSVEVSRRMGLQALGATALVGGIASLSSATLAAAATKSHVIKIGYVTPSTGALADFAGPDKYVLSLIRASSYFKKGITIGKTKYTIEIITADSQSSPSIASQVTTQLIQKNGVDLIVTSSAPETTVPVSAVCEAAGVPCLSTVCPWEAWYVGLGGTLSAQGAATSGAYKYCSMFFFGVPEFVECFLPMWNKVQASTNAKKIFGGMFPNDVDALGSLSNNIATDAWFTPYGPYKSSLTGMTASQFAANYQKATGKQWVQSMGSTYSLFEVVIQALKKVKNPHDRKAVAHAIQTVNYVGMSGPLNFSAKSAPAPGIGIIKPVGIQWKPGSKATVGNKKWSWSPYVVDNTLNKHVPLTGTLEPTNA